MAHVIGAISGVTGMAIIRALLDGERDPVKLATLQDYRIKASQQTIAKRVEMS